VGTDQARGRRPRHEGHATTCPHGARRCGRLNPRDIDQTGWHTAFPRARLRRLMPLVDIHGRRIEYRMVPGDAAARPTLVFLHEGLGSVALWRDFPVKV